MKASGATSMIAAVEVGAHPLGVEHVVEGVEERAQIRVDLRLDVAGQEAEPLARLDRGAGQDDPVDLAGVERRDGHRDRQERLSGPAGPIPKVTVCSRIEST